MRRKIVLDEEVVKYIFTGVHPKVAIGEDGYVAYDFDTTYPSKLAVFIPIKVEPSNYSNVFPRSFEDYFKSLNFEISRLLLLLEKGDIFNEFPEAEYVAGKVLESEITEYAVFQFGETMKIGQRTDLLCRTKVARSEDLRDISAICKVALGFWPELTCTVDGMQYFYWIMPVTGLFKDKDDAVSMIPIIMESLCR